MPKQLRIAHLADTHLGYRHYTKLDPDTGRNQRAVDIERSFERAIDDILTRDVDLVIHAGDVFDHTRPSWSTLAVFIRNMRRIETAGIPCVVIAGNHDTPRLRTSDSVYNMLPSILPSTRFVAGWQEEPFRPFGLDLTVHAVPHGALVNPDPPLPLMETGVRNVIVYHGLAPAARTLGGHEPGEEDLTPEQLDPGADYIALGHFHISGQQTPNAWYSGSTERFGFRDERVETGYNLVILGDPGTPPEVTHIPIESRPMRTLKAVEAADMEARNIANLVLDRVQALDDPTAMVRIELRGAARPVRREAERLVRTEVGTAVWALDLKSPTSSIDPIAHPDRSAELPPLRVLFQEFVDEQVKLGRYDEQFASAFRERGTVALDDAIRTSEERNANEEVAS